LRETLGQGAKEFRQRLGLFYEITENSRNKGKPALLEEIRESQERLLPLGLYSFSLYFSPPFTLYKTVLSRVPTT